MRPIDDHKDKAGAGDSIVASGRQDQQGDWCPYREPNSGWGGAAMRKKRNIYFIKPCGLDGPVKIGISEIPLTRLEQISVWSPWPLELIGYVPGEQEDETFLHECFFNVHIHREWFHSTPILRDTIRKILQAGTVNAVRGQLEPVGSIRSKQDRRRRVEEVTKEFIREQVREAQ